MLYADVCFAIRFSAMKSKNLNHPKTKAHKVLRILSVNWVHFRRFQLFILSNVDIDFTLYKNRKAIDNFQTRRIHVGIKYSLIE